jgi:hypothetical protein
MKFLTEHPSSVGETYWEHMRKAFGFGLAMVIGGLACFFHGLLPPLFVNTGSRTVYRLHKTMVASRQTKKQTHPEMLDLVRSD